MTDVYPESKDPNELKDYVFDWTAKLADGETVSSQTVTLIDAAGTTNPSNSLVSGISRVWLQGGTHGSRAVWTIQVTTTGGRTLEVALGVDVIDSTIGPSRVTQLQALLAEAEQARHDVAIGDKTTELWRDGRRVTYTKASLKDLDAYILRLKQDIADAKIAESGGSSDGYTSTRRAIQPVF